MKSKSQILSQDAKLLLLEIVQRQITSRSWPVGKQVWTLAAVLFTSLSSFTSSSMSILEINPPLSKNAHLNLVFHHSTNSRKMKLLCVCPTVDSSMPLFDVDNTQVILEFSSATLDSIYEVSVPTRFSKIARYCGNVEPQPQRLFWLVAPSWTRG